MSASILKGESKNESRNVTGSNFRKTNMTKTTVTRPETVGEFSKYKNNNKIEFIRPFDYKPKLKVKYTKAKVVSDIRERFLLAQKRLTGKKENYQQLNTWSDAGKNITEVDTRNGTRNDTRMITETNAGTRLLTSPKTHIDFFSTINFENNSEILPKKKKSVQQETHINYTTAPAHEDYQKMIKEKINHKKRVKGKLMKILSKAIIIDDDTMEQYVRISF